MTIIVSTLILLSSLFAEIFAVELVSAFDGNDNNMKTRTVDLYRRRKMVWDDASGSGETNERQLGPSNNIIFDAMALSFDSTNDFLKKRTTENANTSIMKQKNKSFRQLDEGANGLLATRVFPECMEEELSPDECQSLIQQQIDDAGGHEVGDVQVKIQTPRTPEQFAESYWMVEVPVNLYNKVTCDRNDGKTFYPFKWMDGVTGTSLDVEDQDCYGLSASECCLKIRNYGRQLTTTGYDENKQCLSCFVHQEPLEPVLNQETKETDYLECKDTESGDCVQEQLTGAEVDALDLRTTETIKVASLRLEYFIDNRDCDYFENTLLQHLYDAAAVIYPLSMKIGRLACSVCYGENDVSLEDDVVTSQLEEILKMLKHNIPPAKSIDSKENCIIIYTNEDGEVVLDPTLGGSRSDLTGKEVVPHVAPDDDGYYGPCFVDPDYCDETEFCDEFGYCFEDACVTNPPEDCQGRHKVCKPDYYGSYECLTIPCTEDPNNNDDDSDYVTCFENEVCLYDYSEDFFKCQEYKDVGERCGVSDDGTTLVQYGECDPDVAFCVDPFECTYKFEPFDVSKECIAYGESRNLDECCDPESNNCGSSGNDVGNKLICAPGKKYEDYYNYVQNFYTCQKMCDTDDDCDSSKEWCAPVDEQNDPPIYPGKFCKEYKGLGDYCHVKVPSLTDVDLHTEERCNPSNSYCYDPTFCRTRSESQFESECRQYGNVCTSDSDCADPVKEWCDVDIGYCKDRSTSTFLENCCTTFGDESMNDCPLDSSCELYIGDLIGDYIGDDDTITSNSTIFFDGAALCT